MMTTIILILLLIETLYIVSELLRLKKSIIKLDTKIEYVRGFDNIQEKHKDKNVSDLWLSVLNNTRDIKRLQNKDTK